MRRLRKRLLQGVDDVLFHQGEVVHDLGNAPFVFRWPASKALFIDRANKIKEAAMG